MATREELLADVAYGNDCQSIMKSKVWKVIAHRKAALASQLVNGTQLDGRALEIVRAKLDELKGLQHALKNGVEQAKDAEAALAAGEFDDA